MTYQIAGHAFSTHLIFLILGAVVFVFLTTRSEGLDGFFFSALVSLTGFFGASVVRPGIAFSLAALAAALPAIAYCRLRRLDVLKQADSCTPSAALAFAIMKLGCLAVGCCYGVPTSSPFYVKYSFGSASFPPKVLQQFPAWENVPLFPLPLMVSLLALGIFFLSRRMSPHPPGNRFLFGVLAYFPARAVINLSSGESHFPLGALVALTAVAVVLYLRRAEA